jgi:phosphotransferase system enzyme I (PtsI)
MEKQFREERFQGLPISGGVVSAQVCLLNDQYHQQPAGHETTAEDIPREQERLTAAIQRIIQKFERLIPRVTERIGATEANIFTALKMMVQDEELHRKLSGMIEHDTCSAETAVLHVFKEYEMLLESTGDDYIRERISDVTDLKNHLLKELGSSGNQFRCDGLENCREGRNRIVAAVELTPSITVHFDVYQTMGFVSERGGETSHAAILARSLGVPAVSGIKDITRILKCGQTVLINGYTGDVILHPSPATLERYADELNKPGNGELSPDPVAEYTVLANISRAKETGEALKYRAEGIGLYRTEIELIAQGAMLDEQEQYERYVDVVNHMSGKTVLFRLLDIGGDKPLPFFNIPPEDNPSLGLRGARLLLHRPHFLITQARALARASQSGPLGVMYPMISTLEQFLQLKQIFMDAIEDIPHGDITHGVLFEVPSACLQAEEILVHADFASIGTNDLIQYLLAVDRNNDLVAEDYTPDIPAFWSLIHRIVQAADTLQRPVSVCGEIAGEPAYVPRLIQLGIRTVSVNPRAIPRIRFAAREIVQNINRSVQ